MAKLANEHIGWHTEAAIYKFRDPSNKIAELSHDGRAVEELAKENFADLKGVEYIHGNVACNAGLQQMIMLTFGTTGSPTIYNGTNGYIGVGAGNGSAVTAAATDTDLTETGANKLRKQITAVGTRTNQTVTVEASFGSSEANFQWREIGFFNASTAGAMFNHIGSDKGLKSSGETWVVQLSFTFS